MSDLQAPNSTLPPNLNAIKDGSEAFIAVAVAWFAGGINTLFNQVLSKALIAGLRRSSITPRRTGFHSCPNFSVQQFAVNGTDKQTALRSLTQTLKELSLYELSTIAVFTAEETWVTIHGFGLGGIDFGTAFMSESVFEAHRVEMEKERAEAEVNMARFNEMVRQFREKLNPDHEQ